MKRAHNIHKTQKLIRVMLEYDETENTINRIIITGDFFLYPEEALETLETSLIGTRLERKTLKQVIENSLDNTEVYGFDSTSLTEAILGCKT
ncbi:MAG TPA: lipoate protein ligase C-terminal domain-containing protein [Nitrososphaera sp.]|jgi:lipoate-protein ligase A|nr:lipoate protein ligase C-terminal domain-containing protein [Nitrososphaera sp.]HEX2170484.1 lipoate protein ligase C-terminal domain-containing protein [Nitrososphaera sp.]